VLSILSESIAADEHQHWSAIISDLLQLSESPSASKSTIFSTLANIVLVIGPRVIPHIEALVQRATIVLGASHDAPIHSAVSALLANLAKASPTFLATHLKDLLLICVDSSVQAKEGSSNVLVNSLLRNFDVKSLLTAISDLWDLKSSSDIAPLRVILDLLRRLLAKTDRPTIAKEYKGVFRLLLKIFDFRRQASETTPESDISQLEDSSNRAFLQMVLKLNENSFRPLFLRFYDWAAVDLAEEGSPFKQTGIVLRSLTFYRFFNALQDQLKALVANYYSTVFEFTLEGLKAFQDGTLVNKSLWSVMQDSLAKNAEYDEGTFWNTPRAKKAVSALVDGLDTPQQVDQLAEKTAEALCAILQNAPEDALLKSTNRALLGKSRSSRSEVSIAALISLQQFWSRFGEQLLSLVPETAPFISELLDSSDADCVDHTRALVKAIEDVLGEPLDQYIS
jgi:U3 small nucleolar RNA-associated protein 10